MRTQAIEWMQKVAIESSHKNVVLIDEEKDLEHSYRNLLVERIINMFIGRVNLIYMGELFSRS